MKEKTTERIWAYWQFFKTVTITCVSAIVIFCIALYTDLPRFVEYILLSIGTFIIISGITLAILKDIKTKRYICSKCGHEFIPSVKSYLKGNKCPKCNCNSKFFKRDIKL